MTLGFAGSITMQATARLAIKSSNGNHEAPLLMVFQTPASTPPHHMMLVEAGWKRRDRTRPPMLPGPSQVQPPGWMSAASGLIGLESIGACRTALEITWSPG